MALLIGEERGGGLNRFPWRLLRLGRSGSGRAVGVLSVWVWWERFTNWRFKVRPIGPNSFLLYSLSHYSESERTLADGTVLHPGDPIIELHFNNPQVTQLISQNRFTPWRAIKLAGQDIQVLEEAILGGPLNHIKAIHAVTLFASAGTRLGFEVHTLPQTFNWALVRYFMVGLIALYHPDGSKHAARTRQTMWPGEMWMGIESIKRRAEGEKPSKSVSIQE